MFQIFLAVILILAVSHQYDASMATIVLLPPMEGATFHSSTWLQVENIVPKRFQKHCVEEFSHPNDYNPINLTYGPHLGGKLQCHKKHNYSREIPCINTDGITLYKLIILFGNVNWVSSH